MIDNGIAALPSVSANVGDQHASLLLPVWLEKDLGKWSAFGGGCELNRGGDSKNFCEAGFAVTNQVQKDLQLGVEIFHQTADTIGGRDTTSVGTGVRYDLSDRFHLLGYVGRGIQNVDETDRLNWYASVFFRIGRDSPSRLIPSWLRRSAMPSQPQVQQQARVPARFREP